MSVPWSRPFPTSGSGRRSSTGSTGLPVYRDLIAVDAADLERSLDLVRAQAAGSAPGVFGPGSMLWQVDREALVFLGAGRALLLQLAHPWVATAIAEHSTALSDPIG